MTQQAVVGFSNPARAITEKAPAVVDFARTTTCDARFKSFAIAINLFVATVINNANAIKMAAGHCLGHFQFL